MARADPKTMPDRPISVYIAEDDDILRDDLSRSVGEGIGLHLLGSTGSAQEAIRYLKRCPPLDVLLVDLGLPDGDGAELIQVMRESIPQARALVLSVFQDQRSVFNALSAGAQGYLLKDYTDAELLRAIGDVVKGDAPLSPQIARHLLRLFDESAPQRCSAPVHERLTPREAEILTLVAQGHSCSEVAALVGLSQHTVNTHLRNCHTKLDARNRQQAINRARGSGQIG